MAQAHGRRVRARNTCRVLLLNPHALKLPRRTARAHSCSRAQSTPSGNAATHLCACLLADLIIPRILVRKSARSRAHAGQHVGAGTPARRGSKPARARPARAVRAGRATHGPSHAFLKFLSPFISTNCHGAVWQQISLRATAASSAVAACSHGACSALRARRAARAPAGVRACETPRRATPCRLCAKSPGSAAPPALPRAAAMPPTTQTPAAGAVRRKRPSRLRGSLSGPAPAPARSLPAQLAAGGSPRRSCQRPADQRPCARALGARASTADRATRGGGHGGTEGPQCFAWPRRHTRHRRHTRTRPGARALPPAGAACWRAGPVCPAFLPCAVFSVRNLAHEPTDLVRGTPGVPIYQCCRSGPGGGGGQWRRGFAGCWWRWWWWW